MWRGLNFLDILSTSWLLSEWRLESAFDITLFTLLTLFFTVYTKQTVACMPIAYRYILLRKVRTLL